jgi:hypothetical protein
VGNAALLSLWTAIVDRPVGAVFKQTPSADIDLVLNTDYDYFDDGLAHDLTKPLQREITNLEAVMRHIVSEQDELQKNEMKLRDVNGGSLPLKSCFFLTAAILSRM